MDSSLDRRKRYALMKLTRDLDSRFENLLLTGRVSKWYSEVGNEATTVAAGLALEAGDALVTLHRDLGAILARYLDPSRLFPQLELGQADDLRPPPEELLYQLACQLLGRHEGFSQGIERSFHYGFLAPETGILHVGMISHLGAMIPVAAGCAFAFRQRGEDHVALNFIGEGGTSTGDFHEGLNLAAVWKLPLILVVENNGYAFSTPAGKQYAAAHLADRGAGYGIAAETVDGNDPDAMAQAMARAVARARGGEGPTLIEAVLGRMRGHAEGDGSLKVVPEAELQGYLAADPVPAYRARLLEQEVFTQEAMELLEARTSELVETTIERALEAEAARAETALRPVFAKVSAHPERGDARQAQPGSAVDDDEESGTAAMAAFVGAGGEEKKTGESTYLDALHLALVQEMSADSSIVLMGQDIANFEGAFRVTRGLYKRWPNRVFDTPIAESGTLGVAIGSALLGFRPVVEMQFADFISCGFNQLVNVAAKLFYRWQVPCPIVVRLPAGGGVGAGPFHSQNPEGWFTHVAGLKVVVPATARDAGGLLLAAMRDPNPVIFVENKFLYRRIKEVLPPVLDPVEIGTARIAREGSDLTLIGYGVTTWTCLAVAETLASEGVESEVIDLRTLVPLDEETVRGSVEKSGRVVIAHEAQLTSGFGAEVAARIADVSFPWLDAPIGRVAYPDRPSPYAKVLEKALLPSEERILAEARRILAF